MPALKMNLMFLENPFHRKNYGLPHKTNVYENCCCISLRASIYPLMIFNRSACILFNNREVLKGWIKFSIPPSNYFKLCSCFIKTSNNMKRTYTWNRRKSNFFLCNGNKWLFKNLNFWVGKLGIITEHVSKSHICSQK